MKIHIGKTPYTVSLIPFPRRRLRCGDILCDINKKARTIVFADIGTGQDRLDILIREMTAMWPLAGWSQEYETFPHINGELIPSLLRDLNQPDADQYFGVWLYRTGGPHAECLYAKPPLMNGVMR